MNELTHIGLVPTVIQAVGILMVAGLFHPMTQAVPGQFLKYWSFGWAAVAVSLMARLGAAHVDGAHRTPLLVGYCLGEYLFGFLVWAGCREFAREQRFSPGHARLFLPFIAASLALPLMFGDFTHLFPVHALILGGLFLFSLSATFSRGIRVAPTLGLASIRLALAGLSVLFLHHAAIAASTTFWWPDVRFAYTQYLPLMHVLFGTVLAFGMVVLASDRMREVLEGKNQLLAAATADLETLARTDALTGLLNRRAFEELARTPDEAALEGSLAVLDLNDLKRLNDEYGHLVGDMALQVVARALRVHFRVTDPLYRMGGDEFVAVMLGGDADELAQRMTRFDRSLMGQRLPGVRGTVDLHVAWGIADFAAADEVPAAFQAADARMYSQKRARKGLATLSDEGDTLNLPASRSV